MTPNDECWKPVPGWAEFYDVSTHGRVRSRHTTGRSRINGDFLKARSDRAGYLMVRLWDGKGFNRFHRVHRLVMLAFAEPDPSRLFVNHRDHDKHNNRLDNLEWCTPSENIRAALNAGRFSPPSLPGSRHPRAKLNEMQVRVMRRCRESGFTLREVASIFGVSIGRVHYATQRGWQHVRHPSEGVAS